MRDIRIHTLELENFKCHRHLLLVPEGRNARVLGENAAGKTSIYDALTWLLFGKDSAGNGEKLVEVKPLNARGQVADHNAVTSVEAVLLADGEPVRLRRECRELWKKQDGQTRFEGNGYDYFVDGVPMKKAAFDSRIRELLPEEVFRLLTSVGFFAWDMKWQERRAVLFEMAGTVEDRTLMAREERFAPLLAEMGQKSLADCRAGLLARKKNLTGLRDDAPARINECRRVLEKLGEPDFTGLEEELAGLAARPQEADPEQLRRLEREVKCREEEIARCRGDWTEKNSRGFHGDRCPTCGQKLPFDQLTAAAARFDEQKKRDLRMLETRLEELTEARNRAERRLEELKKLPGTGREARMETIRRELAKKELLEQTRQRLAQLQAQAQRAAGELEQVENLLELAEEFVRHKARFAEESVNGLFEMARFRLFRECANGSLEERCDTMYRGVTYPGLNRGARVNVGIDIINTLSRHYGVRVPLFIDNAESVTALRDCGSQVIRLVVSPGDKKVRMEAE